ncbi:hypothetical protein [Microbulbifer halophilus]|uniref:Uncharacterized protein n=1 Tax=Microbulbifer halophilus TaxID=453963 RepID=A0ABW5E775_9GAMM|nr:hypothetical protein [Microbulbifer halophilus]MCW8125593.1 hypothetical protein [Microbulbifer halophilus]
MRRFESYRPSHFFRQIPIPHPLPTGRLEQYRYCKLSNDSNMKEEIADFLKN